MRCTWIWGGHVEDHRQLLLRCSGCVTASSGIKLNARQPGAAAAGSGGLKALWSCSICRTMAAGLLAGDTAAVEHLGMAAAACCWCAAGTAGAERQGAPCCKGRYFTRTWSGSWGMPRGEGGPCLSRAVFGRAPPKASQNCSESTDSRK